ncbi:MAG: hypothetical protein QM766_12500 [Burkholderiaceae bacterium]
MQHIVLFVLIGDHLDSAALQASGTPCEVLTRHVLDGELRGHGPGPDLSVNRP